MFCRRLPGGCAATSMPRSPELSGSVRRISPVPPPKSVRKASAKLRVDNGEGLFEFLTRHGVELVDGLLGVL